MNQLPPQRQTLVNDQNCFALYAAARLVIQSYRPYLDQLGMTYPQYLIIQELEKENGITVADLSDRLFLDAGTVTPILKRLEARGWVQRERSKKDERVVINRLTDIGYVQAEKTRDVSESALNRGRLCPERVGPLVEEAQDLLSYMTDTPAL